VRKIRSLKGCLASSILGFGHCLLSIFAAFLAFINIALRSLSTIPSSTRTQFSAPCAIDFDGALFFDAVPAPALPVAVPPGCPLARPTWGAHPATYLMTATVSWGRERDNGGERPCVG